MKKLLLSTLVGAGALALTLVIRHAMLDMSESDKLWTAVTDNIGDSI